VIRGKEGLFEKRKPIPRPRSLSAFRPDKGERWGLSKVLAIEGDEGLEGEDMTSSLHRYKGGSLFHQQAGGCVEGKRGVLYILIME